MFDNLLRSARPLAAAVAVSVLMTACGDDDPSGPAFSGESAIRAAEVAEDVAGTVAGTFVVQNNVFNALATLISVGGGDASAAMLPFEAIARARSPMAAMSAMQIPTAPNGVLIPEEFEGVTFVWSTEEGGYVPSDVEGAPENGARFVYYAVDPVSGQPAEPLNALGRIDLIDESTQAMSRLEIEVVRNQGNLRLADYFVEGRLVSNLETTTATIESQGFISDGSEQLDFDLSFELLGNEDDGITSEDISIELSNDGGRIELDFAADLDGAQASFVVQGDGNRSVFEFVADGEVITDGSLSFNGRDVVVFEGDMGAPEFTKPNGDPLTATELEALGRMWGVYALTQLFVFQMVFPYFFLLGL